MKLTDLITDYNGTITFDVHKAIEGGTTEVITFSSEDSGAIKDTVLNADVNSYSVEYNVAARAACIKVVLDAD